MCLGAILATPYSLDYDMMALAPAIAFLVADSLACGFGTWEKTALAALWADAAHCPQRCRRHWDSHRPLGDARSFHCAMAAQHSRTCLADACSRRFSSKIARRPSRIARSRHRRVQEVQVQA